MPIKETKTYNISCSCGYTTIIENLKNDMDSLKNTGWSWNQHRYSSNPEIEDFEEIKCPLCTEKERMRKYNSENIWERISAGYYAGENHKKFHDDAIEYVGLKGHPKAEKAYEIARNHKDYYNEQLSMLEELAELLK